MEGWIKSGIEIENGSKNDLNKKLKNMKKNQV